MTQTDFTGAAWRKSRACQDGCSCVEVARVGSRVGVRDSKNGGKGPTLVVGEYEWRTFVAGVRAGDFGEQR
jgi:Domain of unknown function (DUF397)